MEILVKISTPEWAMKGRKKGRQKASMTLQKRGTMISDDSQDYAISITRRKLFRKFKRL